MKLVLGTIFHFITVSTCYNILFMAPYPGPSHWMFMSRFADELLERGHKLTVVTAFPKKTGPHENYTEILMEPLYDFSTIFNKDAIFDMNFRSDFDGINMYWSLGLGTSEYYMNNKRIKNLIEMKDSPFDCYILEQFYMESFLMFGYKFKVPTITISTLPNSHHLDHPMGLLTPWSSVPHFMLPYDDDMTFNERTHNSILTIYDLIFRKSYYIPRMQAMAEKHFGSHFEGPLPSISDLEKNISLILVNSHRATDSPRPTISGLVDIGGAHIQKPKPLPKDIQDFIDSANDGVVYFSLGSFMKCADMPKEKLKIIIDALGKLKQKVLWKYEDESIELPRNVMIKKWMPQNDILAQKNVILFITHGGRFGTLEGSYWGKPMLAIPLFGDQHTNIHRLKRQGVALSLDFLTFTSDELVSKVNTLLTKPFVEKARKISSLFQDNPIQPMDEAMYWIEYVIRHKGAPHLKSKAVDMSVFQYILLDILAIHLGTLVLAGFALFAFVRMFIRLFKKTARSKKATNKKMK